VRRLKKILSVLAAALWLPMTLHCQLETIPGLDFLKCASEKSPVESQSHCDDSCCSVERATYKSEQVRPTLPLPGILPLLPALALPARDKLTGNLDAGLCSTAPPELPKRWQFVFRTASPPRAPSLAS
jgi:hypothetical protein